MELGGGVWALLGSFFFLSVWLGRMGRMDGGIALSCLGSL